MVDKCYPSYDLQYSEPSAMLRFSDEDEGDTYGDDEEIQGDSARLANLTGVAEFADELMGEEEDVDEAEYDGQME